MKLYNEELKEKFLSTYDNSDTRSTIRNVFRKSELVESILDKDVSSMNLTELGKVISNCNPHSKIVAQSIGRFLGNYIDFAIENGYREGSNINPLKGVDLEWYHEFVDKTKKIFYSKKEFMNLLDSMLNAQDQAFLVLNWNGISGKSFIQLRELKFSDINFDTNEVYVKERDLNIKIDDDLMKYLQKAHDQKIFYTYNDETNSHNESELLHSEYLFKNVKSPRSQQGAQVNPSVFYTRLNNLKNEFQLEYLTPNSIKMSGMIKMSVDLFEEHGILAYEQFAEIGEKYDYNKLTANGIEYYNTNLMKNFINQDVIRDLYDIDVIIKKR